MMATFKGTRQEFDRYIGPQIRNLIQYISKKYKASVGQCEHCGAADVQLEAAHRHEYERPKLIDQALEQFYDDGSVVADLIKVENTIKALHDPIDEVILVLCKECHGRYDASDYRDHAAKVLPIKLEPEDEGVFKRLLLHKKIAKIIIHYLNGKSEVKIWSASKFTAQSNIIGNLRSRPEFRNGKWQDRGIKKVTVKV